MWRFFCIFSLAITLFFGACSIEDVSTPVDPVYYSCSQQSPDPKPSNYNEFPLIESLTLNKSSITAGESVELRMKLNTRAIKTVNLDQILFDDGKSMLNYIDINYLITTTPIEDERTILFTVRTKPEFKPGRYIFPSFYFTDRNDLGSYYHRNYQQGSSQNPLKPNEKYQLTIYPKDSGTYCPMTEHQIPYFTVTVPPNG